MVGTMLILSALTLQQFYGRDFAWGARPGGRFFVVLGYALMVNKPLWEKLSATADLELLEPPSYVGPQNDNNGVVVLRYQFKK